MNGHWYWVPGVLVVLLGAAIFIDPDAVGAVALALARFAGLHP